MLTSPMWSVINVVSRIFRAVNVYSLTLTVSFSKLEVSFVIVTVWPSELSLAVRDAI